MGNNLDRFGVERALGILVRNILARAETAGDEKCGATEKGAGGVSEHLRSSPPSRIHMLECLSSPGGTLRGLKRSAARGMAALDPEQPNGIP